MSVKIENGGRYQNDCRSFEIALHLGALTNFRSKIKEILDLFQENFEKFLMLARNSHLSCFSGGESFHVK
jgi:hypothetical protein